jgi:hypothetical protein
LTTILYKMSKMYGNLPQKMDHGMRLENSTTMRTISLLDSYSSQPFKGEKQDIKSLSPLHINKQRLRREDLRLSSTSNKLRENINFASHSNESRFNNFRNQPCKTMTNFKKQKINDGPINFQERLDMIKKARNSVHTSPGALDNTGLSELKKLI